MTACDQQGAKRRRGGAPRRRARAGGLSVFLLMLLALFWQSFVTQTHIHLDPAISAPMAATSGAPARLGSGQPSPELPATCPICQEVAHAGAWLLPIPAAFQAPRLDTVWRTIAASRALDPRGRSHAWHSRAPPNPLQA